MEKGTWEGTTGGQNGPFGPTTLTWPSPYKKVQCALGSTCLSRLFGLFGPWWATSAPRYLVPRFFLTVN